MTTTPNNPPLRIGFLGAGLIAAYHSKSLRRSGAEQAFAVVRAGVHDPDTARAEAFAAASGHTVCATEDEVLDTCDAVYVCTWTSEHPRLVAAAASRGLAVFCEKPLATTLAEAEAMAAVVAEHGVVNQVGLVLRRSPAYRWARQLIDDPAAGPVMSVVFRDDQFIPIQGHYASTWRADRRRAGAGTLLEHSIHDVDMLRFLVGEVTRVSAATANFHGHEGIEDVATATLTFAGGATGTLSSIWHDNLARPSLRRVEIFCARRHIVMDGSDWFGPVSWTDHDGSTSSLAGDDLEQAALALLDGGTNPDGEFVRAVATGTPASPDLATAVAAHRIVDAMYRSAAADGAAVRLDG
jgi:predicted dehydrogenase